MSQRGIAEPGEVENNGVGLCMCLVWAGQGPWMEGDRVGERETGEACEFAFINRSPEAARGRVTWQMYFAKPGGAGNLER